MLLAVVGIGVTIFYLTSGDKGNPTVFNEDGEEVLSPERQAKLDKELDEIDNAAQYALVAAMDGIYPCYTCPDGRGTIFCVNSKYGNTGRLVKEKMEDIRMVTLEHQISCFLKNSKGLTQSV